MSIIITPTFIDRNYVNAISHANALMGTCVDDGVISFEDITKVISELDTNIEKSLDLLFVALKYGVRNYNMILVTQIINKLTTMADQMSSLSDLNKAISMIASLVIYVNTQQMTSTAKDGILRDLGLLNIRFVGKKSNITSPVADELELSDADIRLSALISSMIELVGEESALISSMIESGDEPEKLIQTESVKNVIRHGTEKVTNTIVKFSLAEKQMSDRLNEKFNRFLSNYKADRKATSYDKIVKNSMDLSRMLKNLLTSSIVALLVPGGVPIKIIAGSLALLIQFARNKRTDNKYKGVIINDLKFEMKVVQEKIKDAESKGDNKAKYKLMRIENQIGRAIDRINFNLKAEQH